MRAPVFQAEFGRFLCVGAFNTVVGYLLYWALLSVLPYGAAYTLSYAVGVFISYLLNCRFVFQRKPSWGGALRFPLVYLVQYVLGLGLLAVFVERLHWDRRLAAVAVICCSVPLTFVLSRAIIRSTPECPSPSNEN
jgi:putative flippase GtrA